MPACVGMALREKPFGNVGPLASRRPFSAEKSTVVPADVSVGAAAVVEAAPSVAGVAAVVGAAATVVGAAAVELDELLSLPQAAAISESEMMPAITSRRLTVFT